MRALEKEASRRYPSAIELLQDLKQARAASAVSGVAPAAPRVIAAPRWMQAVGATLMVLLLSVSVWRLRAPSTPTGSPGVHSVAVMTFRTAPDDSNAATVAQELPEELGTALFKTGMQVASRESVLQLGASLKPRDIGAQLGVEGVLDGSVRSYGVKFKVHVELSNARTGFQVWSETFTVEGEDLLTGERKTAAEIAQELRQALARHIE